MENTTISYIVNGAIGLIALGIAGLVKNWIKSINEKIYDLKDTDNSQWDKIDSNYKEQKEVSKELYLLRGKCEERHKK